MNVAEHSSLRKINNYETCALVLIERGCLTDLSNLTLERTSMKKMISILILGVFPGVTLASGDHGGGHDVRSSQVMQKMEHSSHNMRGMPQDSHSTAAGRPGERANISRTVRVTMDDTMRFSPDQLTFNAGETVRFAVRNDGKIRHEMVIGSVAEIIEHADMMRGNPTMQHIESNMITLAPGEYGDVVWQFDRPGSFDFACLVSGHLEAGMTGKIVVR